MRKRVKLFIPFIVGGMLILLCSSLYRFYSNRIDVYEDRVSIKEVNKAYFKIISNLGGSDTYLVSPLALDLAVTDRVSNGKSSILDKADLVNLFNRGYKDFKSSTKWLETISKEENIKYTKDSIEVVLPDELISNVTADNNSLYINGEYYSNEDSYKVDYADGIHELIYYKDNLPVNEDWKLHNGVLKVPLNNFTTTCKVSSLGYTFNQKISYGIRLDKGGEVKEPSIELDYPYNILVRNKKTGLILCGGTIYE